MLTMQRNTADVISDRLRREIKHELKKAILYDVVLTTAVKNEVYKRVDAWIPDKRDLIK